MSEPNKTYADILIEGLKNVNAITGIASIIDLCSEAANYISNCEEFRRSIGDQMTGFEHWTDIKKRRRKDGWE